MAGSRIGGLKAAEKNKAMYGEDFYRKIGRIGGSKSKGGAFSNKEFARQMGRIGGSKSRRTKKELKDVSNLGN